MKRILLPLIFAMLCVINAEAAEDAVVESFRFFIVHPVPSDAVSQIRNSAAESGGYTLFLSNSRLRLSIPRKNREVFLGQLRNMGYVNDEMNSSSDISQSLTSLKTRIKVKKDYLDQLYSVFSSATYTETLEMEEEINNTILEIEELEGTLRSNESAINNIVFDITVSVDSSSNNLRDYGRSQFEWINNLGLQNMMNK